MLQYDCIRDVDVVFEGAEIREGDLIVSVCDRVIVIMRVCDGHDIRDSIYENQVDTFALCLGYCVALCMFLKQMLQT